MMKSCRSTIRSIAMMLVFGWLLGCITPYQPETKSLDGKTLIVEGYITDRPGPHQITLTYTANFTYNAVNYIVDGATVYVTDDKGNRQNFTGIGKGIYRTPASFQGQTGRTYKLSITLPDGRRYESKPELIKPVAAIDRIYDEYTEVPTDGVSADKGFNVYLDTKDPATTGDYYRWIWTHFERLDYCNVVTSVVGGTATDYGIYCCEDCWDIIRCSGSNCVNTMTDEQVNGNAITRQFLLRAPFVARSGYYVELEQLSLSRGAYLYYKAIESLTKNNGGIFDVAPAPLTGNIVSVTNPGETVIGYFSASGAQKVPYVVDRNKGIGTPNFYYKPPPLPGIPPCIACAESDYRTRIKPRWWPF
ncbi:DUF4249 domain-containing protein [Fibrella arboris]|uniref:DUF4249 domain-containing protein n=1 Tax=Fibrella arboris TaxID=3242486 RepID=UPI003522EFD2